MSRSSVSSECDNGGRSSGTQGDGRWWWWWRTGGVARWESAGEQADADGFLIKIRARSSETVGDDLRSQRKL